MITSENINQRMSDKVTYKIKKIKQANKFLYSVQLQHKFKPQSEIKWQHTFPNIENNIYWKNINNQIYKITIDTSFQSFNTSSYYE